MGGSGGGGGDYRGGGGGGGEPPKQDCGSLRFTTTLEQPIGVPEHRRGTVLELLRAQDDGRPVIAAVDDDGTVIGTVTDELPALLRCTGDGWAFVAEVITVNYGVHSVVVRAADRVAVTAVAYTAAGGPASLEPVVLVDAAPVPVDLVIGTATMSRSGICELRSLVRANVPFVGTVGPAGEGDAREARLPDVFRCRTHPSHPGHRCAAS